MNAPAIDRPPRRSRVRAWLILSRASNLPTVWSNCLGGWWLGGGVIGPARENARLALLLIGASALYTAGMWLNDVYDREFDARHRPERPIPAGEISRDTASFAARLTNFLAFWFLSGSGGLTSAFWALLLLACIEFYNWQHKRMAHASWLMAGCRFLLYPLAATAGGRLPPWPALLAGIVLAGYVAGITYLARGESLPGERPPRWPWLLLALPLVGWMMVKPTAAVLPAGWLLLWPFAFWLWRAWRKMAATGRPPVADLLAGIALVDLLVTPLPSTARVMTFAGLFVAARLFQRFVPAT